MRPDPERTGETQVDCGRWGCWQSRRDDALCPSRVATQRQLTRRADARAATSIRAVKLSVGQAGYMEHHKAMTRSVALIEDYWRERRILREIEANNGD